MEGNWTKRLSVGNESLDTEHRELLTMVGDMELAIRAKDGIRLAEVSHRFEQAIRIHFKNETEIAHAIGHPFELHMAEHQYVLNEVHTINCELDALRGRWSESAAEHYYHFLSGWAEEHIAEDDMKMKPLLENYPYDFKPPSRTGDKSAA